MLPGVEGRRCKCTPLGGDAATEDAARVGLLTAEERRLLLMPMCGERVMLGGGCCNGDCCRAEAGRDADAEGGAVDEEEEVEECSSTEASLGGCCVCSCCGSGGWDAPRTVAGGPKLSVSSVDARTW